MKTWESLPEFFGNFLLSQSLLDNAANYVFRCIMQKRDNAWVDILKKSDKNFVFFHSCRKDEPYLTGMSS